MARQIARNRAVAEPPPAPVPAASDWRSLLAGLRDQAERERPRGGSPTRRPRADTAQQLLFSLMMLRDGLHLRFFRRRTRLKSGGPGAAAVISVEQAASDRSLPAEDRRIAEMTLGMRDPSGYPMWGQANTGRPLVGDRVAEVLTAASDTGRLYMAEAHGQRVQGRGLARPLARRAGVGLPAERPSRRRLRRGTPRALPRRRGVGPRPAGGSDLRRRDGHRARQAGPARPPLRAGALTHRRRPDRAVARRPARGRAAPCARRGRTRAGVDAARPPRGAGARDR